MADVERAERELGAAMKRIKTLEEELKRSKKDIETLSIVSLTIFCVISLTPFSKNADFKMTYRGSWLKGKKLRTFKLHCKE